MSRAGDDAESGVDAVVCAFVAAGGAGAVDGRVGLTSSLAIDLPVSNALFSTFAARFMKPTVSAIALAETLPARS